MAKTWGGAKARVPRFCGTNCSAKWRVQTPEGKAGCRAGGRATGGVPQTPEMRAASSQRMTARNPMVNPEVRARAAAAKVGQPFPTKRGGNGTGPTRSEALLKMHLPKAISEFAVGIPAWARPPEWNGRNLKLDLAFPQEKIGIEIDGQSHGTRLGAERDARKDSILSRLGWIVLRFSNAEVLRAPQKAAEHVLEHLKPSTT